MSIDSMCWNSDDDQLMSTSSTNSLPNAAWMSFIAPILHWNASIPNPVRVPDWRKYLIKHWFLWQSSVCIRDCAVNRCNIVTYSAEMMIGGRLFWQMIPWSLNTTSSDSLFTNLQLLGWYMGVMTTSFLSWPLLKWCIRHLLFHMSGVAYQFEWRQLFFRLDRYTEIY